MDQFELIQTYQDSCERSLSLSSRLNSAEIRRVIAAKFRLRERTEISAQAKIRLKFARESALKALPALNIF